VIDPYETGDLKLLMVDGTAASRRTALRLRDSEEDGCLWRLRCSDDGLRARIKRVLVET
jgi:AP-4 complex subunit epsilon-1